MLENPWILERLKSGNKSVDIQYFDEAKGNVLACLICTTQELCDFWFVLVLFRLVPYKIIDIHNLLVKITSIIPI